MTGMFRNYIRHPDGRIEECDDVIQFAEWFDKLENRQIALDAVPYGPDGKDAVIVSTVFLGMDHNFAGKGGPVLFETLAECPDDGGFQRRYRTEEEALKGHREIIELVEEHLEAYQEVFRALDAVVEPLDEVPRGFEVIPDPVPRRKFKLQPPKQKAPDPACEVCRGEGEIINEFDMAVICECTVIPAG